ncbi:MAG: hypothetical protein ACYDCO_26535 [Armatimonadota bacterium]
MGPNRDDGALTFRGLWLAYAPALPPPQTVASVALSVLKQNMGALPSPKAAKDSEDAQRWFDAVQDGKGPR